MQYALYLVVSPAGETMQYLTADDSSSRVQALSNLDMTGYLQRSRVFHECRLMADTDVLLEWVRKPLVCPSRLTTAWIPAADHKICDIPCKTENPDARLRSIKFDADTTERSELKNMLALVVLTDKLPTD